MGSIQCTSSRNTNITFKNIEKTILKNNSPLDKKIQDEYYSLKNLIKELNSIDHSDKKDTLPVKKGKLIIEYVPPCKKLKRFLKWSQMIFGIDSKCQKTEQKVFTPKARPFLKGLDLSPRFKRSSADLAYFPENISVIPMDNDEKPNLNVSSFYMDNNDFSITKNIVFSTKILSNVYDENLTAYFQSHKEQFLERISKGPPQSLRWISWLIAARIPEIRYEELFVSHLKEQVSDEIDQQIKRDLNRTLLESWISQQNEGNTQGSLYKVLKAFSSMDKDVSYCQGINFISGFLLSISDFNEIDTFYMLISLFSHTYSDNFGLRGFFSENFPLLNAYLYIFNHFFEKRMPELKSHFEKLDIPQDVWIGKWIQTLYTICLPLDSATRVWDCLFAYGLDFIIPFSISLLQQLQKDLLKLEDSLDVIDYFKEAMSPVDERRNPTFGFHSKTYKNEYEVSDVINIEIIIDHAKKLYKSMNMSAISSIKREFESKYSIDLESLNMKYDMIVYAKPCSESDSQQLNKSINISQDNSGHSHLNGGEREKILSLNLLPIESEVSKKSSTDLSSEIANLNEINELHPMIGDLSNGGISHSNSNKINFNVISSNTNNNINLIYNEGEDDYFASDEFEGINLSNEMTSHVFRKYINLTAKNA